MSKYHTCIFADKKAVFLRFSRNSFQIITLLPLSVVDYELNIHSSADARRFSPIVMSAEVPFATTTRFHSRAENLWIIFLIVFYYTQGRVLSEEFDSI
ncbi:hypothetical protein CDAR_505001 [Caerostris darwini]|uniref:Uncharacterized protein n=1 Tax=Caerostris darwini TaxID=1538125 RepID=A0AAV4MS58_9ARAC|nr:hypothetical protein CDAR_505001 [Caerostris darwini]